MEMNKEYASKGVAGTGLGLGIAGTALGLMNGGLGGILGGCNSYNNNNCCSEDKLVNRYELSQSQRISTLETEVALRDANIFTDQKIADVFDRLSTRINAEVRNQADINTQQAVYNATNTAGITCLQGQVGALQSVIAGFTKTVIPNSAICPGWGDVCVNVVPCPTPKA